MAHSPRRASKGKSVSNLGPKEVRGLIRAGEGQTIEIKTSFSEQNEAIEALCAFTNSRGGCVLVGVADDGTTVGVQLGNRTLEEFANRLRLNTEPRLTPAIDKVMVDDRLVIVIDVQAASPDQVFHAFGTPRIRVGKTNQVMPPDQIRARLFASFRADAKTGSGSARGRAAGSVSWQEQEKTCRDLSAQPRSVPRTHLATILNAWTGCGHRDLSAAASWR